MKREKRVGLKKNKSTNAVLWILCLFVLSACAKFEINNLFDPYEAVRDSPQIAFLKPDPKLTIKGIKVNNRDFRLQENLWEVYFSGPHPGLGGIDGIHIENTKTIIRDPNYNRLDHSLSIYFSADSLRENTGKSVDLTTSPLLDILVLNEKGAYDNNKYLGSEITCKQNADDLLVAMHGTFKIDAFEQSYKHMKLKGSIHIDPTVLLSEPHSGCIDWKNEKGKDSRINISVEEISFDIDSEVIYQWAGKSGHPYQL